MIAKFNVYAKDELVGVIYNFLFIIK